MHRQRRGFTIIELLVVMAILGLLASIALPKLSATRQRASVASMISDLRTLTTAQEGFFVTYHDYAGGISGTEVPGPGAGGRVAMLASSSNVISVQRRSGPLGDGWSATVTNASVTDPTIDECGVFVGDASFSPNAAVVKEGVPACY